MNRSSLRTFKAGATRTVANTSRSRACNGWGEVQPYYSSLSVHKWSPRQILGEKQEEDLFKNVAGYPEAELAYGVAAITNNTTASGVELRCLKLENVFLWPAGEISEIYIPPEACKNDHRPRKIALNDVALWAVRKVYQRAIKLGSTKPEHYLFPFRTKLIFMIRHNLQLGGFCAVHGITCGTSLDFTTFVHMIYVIMRSHSCLKMASMAIW